MQRADSGRRAQEQETVLSDQHRSHIEAEYEMYLRKEQLRIDFVNQSQEIHRNAMDELQKAIAEVDQVRQRTLLEKETIEQEIDDGVDVFVALPHRDIQVLASGAHGTMVDDTLVDEQAAFYGCRTLQTAPREAAGGSVRRRRFGVAGQQRQQQAVVARRGRHSRSGLRDQDAAKHVPAPAPKEHMQGVRWGEHLPAPAHQEHMQGLP